MSRFTQAVVVLMMAARCADSGQPADPTPQGPGVPAMEDLRILVVDDRPENAKLLDRLLRRWGHREVTTTTRSSEVAELCAASDYDLLLLDLHMPSPDGFAGGKYQSWASTTGGWAF